MELKGQSINSVPINSSNKLSDRERRVRLNSRNEDYQCPKELEKNNMKGAGVGIPAINNNVFGTNGFKSNKKNAIKEAVKIKLNPETKIGHKITAVGPGGRTNVTNRENMPGEPNVRSSKK